MPGLGPGWVALELGCDEPVVFRVISTPLALTAVLWAALGQVERLAVDDGLIDEDE